MKTETLLELIQLQADMAELGHHLSEVMTLVVERVLPLFHADGAAIELGEEHQLVYRAVSGTLTSYLGFRIPIQNSLAGLALTTHQTLISDDIYQDTRVHSQAAKIPGLESMVVVPLTHHDKVVGVLKLISAQRAHFQPQCIPLLEMLGKSLSAAMYFATELNQDSLWFKATHDELTGLGNRALLMDHLKNAIVPDKDHQAAVLMLDMNGLKKANDNFGHQVGDALIKTFAERTQSLLRPTDLMARLGGDEFAIVLKPTEGVSHIESFQQQLNTALAAGMRYEDKDYPLSASLGGALFPAETNDLAELLHLADQRMYADKQRHYDALRRASHA